MPKQLILNSSKNYKENKKFMDTCEYPTTIQVNYAYHRAFMDQNLRPCYKNVFNTSVAKLILIRGWILY